MHTNSVYCCQCSVLNVTCVPRKAGCYNSVHQGQRLLERAVLSDHGLLSSVNNTGASACSVSIEALTTIYNVCA
eukprot:5180-Heterococcus_DN1.PRE.3